MASNSCDVEDFMAAMLGECSPAYVNNCARTMKALMNHAVKRQFIAASPLTEKIRFEDVPLPELELTDDERLAFLGAFDDERGFKQDVGKRRRDAHVVTSEHFTAPRKFGFGPNLDSDARAFRALPQLEANLRCRDRDGPAQNGSAEPRVGTG